MKYTLKNYDILPNYIEENILKLINKNPPECYNKLSKNEIDYLTTNIINNSEYKKYNISL